MTDCMTRHPLLVDLYQLTMMQTYLDRDMTDSASFEFYVRELPPSRRFLMAAGLENVIDFLSDLHFDGADLENLQRIGFDNQRLLDYLADLRFAGDIEAMPEGSVFFANEPIFRLTAPLPVAQLLESRIINLLHFSTLIASKAIRIRLAAKDCQLIDFGMRRAHGAEAAMLAARASYLAGFDGTATVLAGINHGIPLFGTMAHSYVLAHENEVSAFLDFARSHPANALFLIDTYDTLQGARKAVEAAKILQKEGIVVRGVRLDSGDILSLSKKVRRILDEGGLPKAIILASGNLDEYSIHHLISENAPIDGFGVGTRLDVSADGPYLECAYKLQEYAGQPKSKYSPGKANLPGRKQVYRRYGDNGLMCGDTITLADAGEKGDGLLQPIMQGGRLLNPLPSLALIREYALRSIQHLPDELKELSSIPMAYPVSISDSLSALMANMAFSEK